MSNSQRVYVSIECLIGQFGEAKRIQVPAVFSNHPDLKRDSNGWYSWIPASRLLTEIPESFVSR